MGGAPAIAGTLANNRRDANNIGNSRNRRDVNLFSTICDKNHKNVTIWMTTSRQKTAVVSHTMPM
jgi:hypothetical protein